MKTHQNTVFRLLVLMLVITGCAAPRISIFGKNGEPLKEYTLQGSTKGKVLILSIKGKITDDVESGLIRKKPSMVQEIVAQLKKAEKYENDTIYNMQSTWTGGDERLTLIDLGLPASETSEVTTGFYYMWLTAAGGR